MYLSVLHAGSSECGMLVREGKLLNGTSNQYKSLDEAIRTAQFIRNKAVRYWMDNQGVNKSRLYKLSKELGSEFPCC